MFGFHASGDPATVQVGSEQASERGLWQFTLPTARFTFGSSENSEREKKREREREKDRTNDGKKITIRHERFAKIIQATRFSL
jgi:hypothetical protein